jgi:cysteine desulfurase
MSVYLDCAATTPLDPRVREIVLHYLDQDYGNAASRGHDFGSRARRAVEKSRDQLAVIAGSSRGEVFFTSGATESNNLAILGLADHGLDANRRHIIATQIEHNAVLEPLAELSRRGFDVTFISPDEGGAVSAQAIANTLRPDTLLVSVMHVNNETGVIQPIAEIADALADRDAYFHVDAAQSFGKILDPLRHPRIDLISLSGHKIFAPKGVGALIARRRGDQRPPLSPLLFGGGQERGLRPGTLPVPLIAALGLAAELGAAEADERATKNLAFRHRLLEALSPLRPNINGDSASSVPHVVNLSFPGIDADDAIEALADVAAISNGSACTSNSLTCSHVLGAMKLDPQRAAGATRWSWCHLTPEPDYSTILSRLRAIQHGR